jgi:hypothetical protein
MEKAFGFSDEVATLMISLFIAGYCLYVLLSEPCSTPPPQARMSDLFVLS